MPDLSFTRVFKAPPSTVWECWTTPEHLKKWFVPPPAELPEVEIDPRPGGRFFTVIRYQGRDMPGDGVILESIPGRRLVFTSVLMQGWKPAKDVDLPFSAIIELEDHPEGTFYRVTARHPDDETARRHEEMGFSRGWGTAADQLGRLAAGLQAQDGRTMVIERSFRASPAQVYRAWTDPEALPRWFGPEGWTCETERMDLRVGGEWRFTMRGDGMEFANRHRWTALVPPEGATGGRIEFLMDGLDGDEPKAVSVLIEPEGEGTRLTQRMVFPSTESLDLARSYGAPDKGRETLRKLAAHLGE